MNVFTVKMTLLTAVVLKEDAAQVKKKLLSLGLVDFTEIEASSSASLTHAERDRRIEQVESLLQQVESLYRQIERSLPILSQGDIDRESVIDLDSAVDFLERLNRSLASLRDEQKKVTTDITRYSELSGYLKASKHEYLDLHIGRIGKESYESLEARLASHSHVLLKSETSDVHLLLTLSRERPGVNPVLDAFSWSESVGSHTTEEAHRLLMAETSRLIEQKKSENQKIIANIRETIGEKVEKIETIYREARVYQLLGYISGHFSSTRNTTIFSGWIPSEKSGTFEEELKKVTNNACVIEYTDEKQFDRSTIPVALDDLKPLKPFQSLVKNYSTPQYGTINPTIFVAISYLVMFGLMFADTGQGIIILLVGLIGTKRNRDSSLLPLLIYLGISSIISGLLFGSFFGFELIPPLWFNYHEAVYAHGETLWDVYRILGLTLKFGIVVIYVGIILNWINLVKRKKWLHLVFDRNGIIGAFLFAIGIYFSYGFIQSGYTQFPSATWLTVSVLVSVILLYFRVPLEHFLEKKGGPFLFDSITEWLLTVFEIFTGFLSNTLSFMRVAGLGIAHVALMATFRELSALPGNAVGAVLVLVAGNILVIGLEGLSAAIQSLRLNYYEFFTKFFVGDGKEYRPINLKTNSDGLRHREHTV